MLVIGDFDGINRFIIHLKAGCPQQRGIFVKVEPQRLDVVFFLGCELDDLSLRRLCLGLLHVEVRLEVTGGGQGVGHLQLVGSG